MVSIANEAHLVLSRLVLGVESEMVVAATNEKVSNYIHDDIAFLILSKLPVKSVKRFGCVRKSWSLLFENPNFMCMYRSNFISNHRSCYPDASLLLNLAEVPKGRCKLQNILYSLSEPERFENRIKLDWPNPFQDEPYFEFFGSGSINGTFCLYDDIRKIVVLWNPATKEFKVIPRSPVESSLCDPFPKFGVNLHGFGYDHVRDDYKVIRHVGLPVVASATTLPESNGDSDTEYAYMEYVHLWEIYSLRSNSWSKLDVDMPASNGFSAHVRVYMDGMCHWLCHDFIKAFLVSFDLSNEVFFITPIPFDTGDSFDGGVAWRDLVVFNRSIALISYHKQLTTFNIQFLGELGVKESWTKLLVVGPLPCVEFPIGMGKKAEIFFIRKDGELAWFDLSAHMVEELGVKGRRYGNKIVIYKESLLPIGGINNYSFLLFLPKRYMIVVIEILPCIQSGLSIAHTTIIIKYLTRKPLIS